MCYSYSLLGTVLPLLLLVNTSALLSNTRNKIAIDDRRDSEEQKERTHVNVMHERTTHNNNPFPGATRRQRRRLRGLSDVKTSETDSDGAHDTITYQTNNDNDLFDWRMANASVSLSAFAYCANDTIVSFKVHYSNLSPSSFHLSVITYRHYLSHPSISNEYCFIFGSILLL